MAQYIFWNWQDDDSTKNLNHRTLGINEYGRYRGFDANLSTPGGLTLRLHQNNGFDVTKFDTPTYTVEKRGVLVTKQGVVLHETSAIDLTISAGDATHPRIDLIICEHEYVDVQGASVGVYDIIQGTPSANPVAPTLPMPDQIKVVLGTLYVPAGMTALTDAGVVYTPSATPTFANDDNIVMTFKDQYITEDKTFARILLEDSKELIYNGTLHTLDFQNAKSNVFHYGLTASVNYFIQVDNFINVPYTERSYHFKILSGQNLEFTLNGNVVFGVNNNTTLKVMKGEVLEVYDINGIAGTPLTAPRYYVHKGGEVKPSLYNKMYNGFSLAKGLLQNGTNAGATENIELAKNGNLYEIELANGVSEIRSIPNHNAPVFWIFTPPKENAGTKLYVKIKTNPTGGSVTIKHNYSTPPTGYKPIKTITNADVIVADNAILELIEFETYYALLSVHDTALNIYAISAAISAMADEVWTKFGPYTMPNGHPAPTLPPLFTNAGSGNADLRLRKNHLNQVELNGSVTATLTHAGGGFYFLGTMPSGYRPTYYQLLSIHATDASTNQPMPVSFEISTAGVMILLVDSVNYIPNKNVLISFNNKYPLN